MSGSLEECSEEWIENWGAWSIIREEFPEEKKMFGEVECFYCKSWVSKDYAKEMGLGKDDKMKYICLKCFKQEPQMVDISRDGLVYLPEGEYVIPTGTLMNGISSASTADNDYFENRSDTS